MGISFLLIYNSRSVRNLKVACNYQGNVKKHIKKIPVLNRLSFDLNPYNIEFNFAI